MLLYFELEEIPVKTYVILKGFNEALDCRKTKLGKRDCFRLRHHKRLDNKSVNRSRVRMLGGW